MSSNTFRMETSYPREVEKAKKENWPVILPVGTMEYHSSICPYGCDALVAQGVAENDSSYSMVWCFKLCSGRT